MALDTLTNTETSSHPPLNTISDNELLSIAKEMLANFLQKKHEWKDGCDWAAKEAELYKLSGYPAEWNESSSPFTMSGMVVDYLSTFIEALEYKLGGTEPQLLSKKRAQVMDDGSNAEVYGPVSLGKMFPGNTFEVFTSAADAEKEVDETDGADDTAGKVCIVLGAGNQSGLALVDTLNNTLRHKRPVLLKHHPLRPWLAEPYGIILEPLSRRGYFAQVQDESISVTKALLLDPSVGHVHVTGALKTSQAIHETLQNAHPGFSNDKIKSMITSELGCATPAILDDGVYTETEIQHACQIIAFTKKVNGGCNCLSTQVVVLPKHWAQKDIFRTKLLEELKRQPTTPCYYPGSLQRKAQIIDECKLAGSKCDTMIAPSVSEDTKVSEADHVTVVECGTPGEDGFNSRPLLAEAFGSLLAIVELDCEDGSTDEDEYLAKTAVPFLNNKDNIFGSLSCSVFTPASKGKAYEDRKGLQSALASLRYGATCVNQSNLFGYLTATKGGIWAGHPMETLGQSGNGHIGDLYGIIGNSKHAKSVLYGPSLENKPMFDLANNPPAIVFDVLMELTCTPSLLTGMMGALKLVMTRSVYGLVSYLGLPIKGEK